MNINVADNNLLSINVELNTKKPTNIYHIISTNTNAEINICDIVCEV